MFQNKIDKLIFIIGAPISLVIIFSFLRYLYISIINKHFSLLLIPIGLSIIIISRYIIDYRIRKTPATSSSYEQNKYLESGVDIIGNVEFEGVKYSIFRDNTNQDTISNLMTLLSIIINIVFILVTFHTFGILSREKRIFNSLSLFGSVESVGFTFLFAICVVIMYMALEGLRFSSLYGNQKTRRKAHEKWKKENN